jgi:hypothetical protein
MARRVTYTVHDGGGDDTPAMAQVSQPVSAQPVPQLTPPSQAKNAIVATILLSVLSAVIGIATSRWGGVSQSTFDTARTNDKETSGKWQGEITSKVNGVDAKIDKLVIWSNGVNVLFDQAAQAGKKKKRTP